MTTTQAARNDLRVSPPPASVENPAELNSADLPANQDNLNNNTFESQISDLPLPGPAPSASAYHVPPQAFTPSPNPRQPGEYAESAKRLGSLPSRCQFMFSDGRQCTMARSDIHPSLCVYHSEREEQLFGDPFSESHIRGRSYDLPELFSASRDLSTAAGVNRALAQVFRLLAQRRISRQEAATFGHLAKLLLRTISLMAAESDGAQPVILSERSERRISPEFSSQQEFPPSQLNQVAPRPNATSPVVLSEPTLADESKASSVPLPATPNSSAPAIVASPESPSARVAMSNSRRISTSSASVCNSPQISTYENAGDQVTQNEHLQKNERDRLVCAR